MYCAVKRVYHTVTPVETKKKSADGKIEGYFRNPEPRKMSARSLKNHFCDPWYGCDQCETRCEFGKEYMRRLDAGEIAPMQLLEAAT